jgi:hypothetical protein
MVAEVASKWNLIKRELINMANIVSNMRKYIV